MFRIPQKFRLMSVQTRIAEYELSNSGASWNYTSDVESAIVELALSAADTDILEHVEEVS